MMNRGILTIMLVYAMSSLCAGQTPESVYLQNYELSGFPQAEISNGLATERFFLPDPVSGYYQSTRFDWSGELYSLRYNGDELYGQWYDRVDKDVINWLHPVYEPASALCSALMGPFGEFEIPPGGEESEPGGEGRYIRYYPFEALNRGKWSVTTGRDLIEFIKELFDPGPG